MLKHIQIIEGYHYSREEIEAYQVPFRIKAGPCVDTYIPVKKCFHDHPSSFVDKMLDGRYFDQYIIAFLDVFFVLQRKGKCSKEFSYYKKCLHHWQTYENNNHVSNAFWANSSQAKADGLSGTFAQNYGKGLAWLN